MSYRTCDHLLEDGIFCSSPALRNQRFCYFHFNLRARRVQQAQSRRKGESCRLHLPILDNMHAVQAALQQVGDALADDRIDYRRANGLLYLLQQAAANLNNSRDWQGRRPQVEAAQPFRALEAPDVADEYELPQNVDLALPPDAALDAAEQSADSPLQDGQPRSLARVPARAASAEDPYFHIPKDPGLPITMDELSFNLSRMEAEVRREEEARGTAAAPDPPRPAPASDRPQKAANVA
jgi:hypothetical protein